MWVNAIQTISFTLSYHFGIEHNILRYYFLLSDYRNIIYEIMMYAIYISIVYVISLGNRDLNGYPMVTQLTNSFVNGPNFATLNTSNDWWDWAQSTIVTQLRASTYYNGNPAYGLKGYIGDYQNRIMGYAVLRIVRVKSVFNVMTSVVFT